jgi:hypothetical protein
MATFSIPVEMVYNGQIMRGVMGPFQHSTEREFAMAVNRRAIEDCSSLEQLKGVSKNLLEGWSLMNTALQSIMLENIQLRQALDKKEIDLRAADELMTEAAEIVQQCAKQSKKAKSNLWPW